MIIKAQIAFWFFSTQASVLDAPWSSVLNTSAVVLFSSIWLSFSAFDLGLPPRLLYVAIMLLQFMIFPPSLEWRKNKIFNGIKKDYYFLFFNNLQSGKKMTTD